MNDECEVPMKAAECCIDRSPTIPERLAESKNRLETQLAQVNLALAALKDNPGAADMLIKVAKALDRRL